MPLAELFIIGLYFLFRLILHSDEVVSIDSSRKYRILLGIIWLPILTGSYWLSILDYDPCSFCAPPLHISIFLGWLVFLVTDCLYQLLMLSKNAETATFEN